MSGVPLCWYCNSRAADPLAPDRVRLNPDPRDPRSAPGRSKPETVTIPRCGDCQWVEAVHERVWVARLGGGGLAILLILIGAATAIAAHNYLALISAAVVMVVSSVVFVLARSAARQHPRPDPSGHPRVAALVGQGWRLQRR